jgi:hypothetical protein
MFQNENFITLNRLASRFDLPRNYLRGLADRGLIPSLDVNGHRKFNTLAVEKALERLQNAEQRQRPTILGSQGTSR